MKAQVILGPPGTGKTHDLVNRVEKLIKQGVPPNRIAYFAFTRKAAAEAKRRLAEHLDLSEDDLKWVRTIHSLAFKQSGISARRLMKREHFAMVLDKVGFDFSPEQTEEEEQMFTGPTGDALVFIENLARVKGVPLEDQWATWSETRGMSAATIADLVEYRRALTRFKDNMGLVDHTDALTKFMADGMPPPIDALLVDEAQDLSTLQWNVVEKCSAAAKQTILAGDDDQAIFRWAGADVARFQAITAAAESSVVLDQSYRVPVNALRVADTIVRRIKQRSAKDFKPTAVEGSVDIVADDERLDAGGGSWLFLCRHAHQLRELEKLCRERGWFYASRNGWSNKTDAARAIIANENLRRGSWARAADVEQMLLLQGRRAAAAQVSQRHAEDQLVAVDVPGGVEVAPWTETFSRMSATELEYFVQSRRAGEKMAVRIDGRLEPAEPRVTISTVHGSKGGQADGVYLTTDVTESTMNAMERDADDEHRVFYVGTTRTRNKLVIRRPLTNLGYQVGE